MLKEGDKLTHFMTSILVFIEGHKQVLDFYPKQSEHSLNKLHLTPTEIDEIIFNEFSEAVLQYCVKLNDLLPEGTEAYINSLIQIYDSFRIKRNYSNWSRGQCQVSRHKTGNSPNKKTA